MRLTRQGGVAALAVMALFLGAAPAAGHVFTVNSTITISYSNGKFSGTVSSQKTACIRERFIKLYKVKPGKDDVVKFTRSDHFGNYEIPKTNVNGRYYVKVQKRIRGRYGHHHQCNGDKSRTLTF